MFKQISIGEVKIGERKYSFTCDSQSPLGEIHDGLMQMKGYIVERMVAAQKAENEAADQQRKLDHQEQQSQKE